jgi:hypothetical protein
MPDPRSTWKTCGGEREAEEDCVTPVTRHAGDLFAGLIEYVNCAVLINVSVSGKLTRDDSSMQFHVVEG